MSIYAQLINHRFAYTYAIIDNATGEVSTYACDRPSIAFRNAYRRMDSIRRECRRLGAACDLHLVNCVTGVEILAIKY